jgi:hypothetical protein
MESSIYKGLAMGAQANKSKSDALAKRLRDAKVLAIQPGKVHPLLQDEANDIVAKSTAEMMLAAQQGQDPTPIQNVYRQRLSNIEQQGEMFNEYTRRADDKHYVDRDVVASMARGDKEGIDKALEKYPEDERWMYDPRQNPMPLAKRDISSELSKSITLNNNYSSFVPGNITKIPGTGDVRVEMVMTPKAKRENAIRFAQDPEVQENIMYGQYKNLYKSEKEKLIKGGMKAEVADGEAMVKVIESMMPTYHDQGREANVTNIYTGEDGNVTAIPVDSMPFKMKTDVSFDDGTTMNGVSLGLTTGKYFMIPLGKEVPIPVSAMKPIDGKLPSDKTSVINVKQGGVTSIPIATKAIKLFDKESGKTISVKAGDPILDEWMDVVKANPDVVSSVRYKPVSIYTYDVKDTGGNLVEKHGFTPASGTNIAIGFGDSKVAKSDAALIYQELLSDAKLKNEELDGLAKQKPAEVPAQPASIQPTPVPAAKDTTVAAPTAPTPAAPKPTPVAPPKASAPGLIPKKTKVSPSIKPEQKDSLKGVLSTYDPKKKASAVVNPVNKPDSLVSKPTTEVKNNKPDASATGSIHDYYNIKPYATQKDHEKIVDFVYKKIATLPYDAKSIGDYIKKVAKDSELTGEMILKAATEHGVDPRALLSILQVDSTFGTKGKGKRTKNPGNVGNDDSGRLVYYKDWQSGVSAAAKWLAKHRK